ncbi:NADPH-dependent 2,4-dienoyl-CoA reductase/sulfur reductase-like enzyme [Kribbella aluminosa]|uniref:NADPH-dependent 2,4-dienoyl-CoA reductase/sulfur reductase-like enzyme n=1 Tax=Kribbella aluminosa TaxID=416017 RepID=A0ABS4UUL0_9ACTN|nr:FAD-dependent oxidoreductase [Kribbella aluminosa]MBP2355333.1 NADPH-dependent 2,4-dienoyl-CoA reductase/sulfur reductase-like enzyme [Kribbella aluminosa]
MSVLVVGASAAGLTTAEALRRKGFRDPITVLGAEYHRPYDRPPLSKQFLLGDWDETRTRLRPDTMLTALDAEFVLGDPAVALDGHTVHTTSGRSLTADHVVIATGLTPRRLPGPDLEGVHVLRTLDDAAALRRSLTPEVQVVVVGDGVLGAEIAATVCKLGLSVTLAGPQAALMEAQLGAVVGGLLGELHTAAGVELRLGVAVDGLTGVGGRVSGVRLANGDLLPADVVVVALGAAPATGWLEGSGLTVENGVVCDEYCRAADGVYAAGDVARWRAEDRLVRLENRTNATEQALCVAANILGERQPYRPIPYFWTDQFSTRLQVHGRPSADLTIAEGNIGERFVAHYRDAGRIVGVLGWNAPKQTRAHRQHLVRT